MSRLIRKDNLNDRSIEYSLVIDNPERAEADIEMAFATEEITTLTLDISELDNADRIELCNSLDETVRKRCIIFIDAARLTPEVFESFINVSELSVTGDGYEIKIGTKDNPEARSQFGIYRRNFLLKEKSYEMEIIESLLTSAEKENQRYQTLRSQYESLKARNTGGRDIDLENRYIELMDKYRQALQRLDKLRRSKLGRLQMAYWRKRGRGS